MNNIDQLHQAAFSIRSICDPATTIIRISDLSVITGFSRPTIYRRLKDDPSFPKAVPLSNSKGRGAPVGWILAEVQHWVRQRIALRGEAA